MERCEVCGNEYDKAFKIIYADQERTFDCFECAVHALAPRCEHCDVRILGHGMEARGHIYCSAHCARSEGVREVSDRAEHVTQ